MAIVLGIVSLTRGKKRTGKLGRSLAIVLLVVIVVQQIAGGIVLFIFFDSMKNIWAVGW